MTMFLGLMLWGELVYFNIGLCVCVVGMLRLFVLQQLCVCMWVCVNILHKPIQISSCTRMYCKAITLELSLTCSTSACYLLSLS